MGIYSFFHYTGFPEYVANPGERMVAALPAGLKIFVIGHRVLGGYTGQLGVR